MSRSTFSMCVLSVEWVCPFWSQTSPVVTMTTRQPGMGPWQLNLKRPNRQQFRRNGPQNKVSSMHYSLGCTHRQCLRQVCSASQRPRPPTTGAANPQMPAATTEDPGTRTSTKEEVITQEIYLQLGPCGCLGGRDLYRPLTGRVRRAGWAGWTIIRASSRVHSLRRSCRDRWRTRCPSVASFLLP